MDHRHLKKIEDQLWEAADQLRANSKLTASEYAMPVLGLIFCGMRSTALWPCCRKLKPRSTRA